MRHSCRFAEPGPYQTPAFVTAPALQRTASQGLRAALRPGNESSRRLGKADGPRERAPRCACPPFATVVIPGCALLGAGPESITTIGGYGFRARAKRRAPE